MTLIFHPTDFSTASEHAFVHALKFALAAQGGLAIFHAGDDLDEGGTHYPGVRKTLERWGILPRNSPPSAVGELGLDVRKVVGSSRNPVKACLGYLEKHPCDLIVLAVQHHEGRMRWLKRGVGEPIAHGAGEPTLFLPHGVKGFVSREDGSVSLRHILIPVASRPGAQPALETAAQFMRHLRLPGGTVTLLHVGPEASMPPLEIPRSSGWSWISHAREGDPAEVILEFANHCDVELIMMTTAGSHGFLDALRGSTSERVLRGAGCAVVSLPA